MSLVSSELATQPELWPRAAALAQSAADRLPEPGQRVVFFGCGTSFYMAEAAAALREAAGHGESDAYPASELPVGRRYELAVAISRSGSTTEVLEATGRLQPSTPVLAVTAQADGELGRAADRCVALDFADEQSVVQTRFATCSLAFLRAGWGDDLTVATADAGRALREPLVVGLDGLEQLVFLGRGWTVGLAREAALKVREAAHGWCEAYPAMEYRHGPISVAREGTVVWCLSPLPYGLAGEIRATGARLLEPSLDPMAELVRAQRLAVTLGEARGLDVDSPRHLRRSVILSGAGDG